MSLGIVYFITGKELENKNTLSREAQEVYNIIKSNNKEGIKVCYEAVWDELKENNKYNIEFAEMKIYIDDMVWLGLLNNK